MDWILNPSYFLIGCDIVTPVSRKNNPSKWWNERKLHVGIFPRCWAVIMAFCYGYITLYYSKLGVERWLGVKLEETEMLYSYPSKS